MNKKSIALRTSAKRRLKVALLAIPVQTKWIDWFGEKGNSAEASRQRRHVNTLYKRVARLKTHLERKSK